MIELTENEVYHDGSKYKISAGKWFRFSDGDWYLSSKDHKDLSVALKKKNKKQAWINIQAAEARERAKLAREAAAEEIAERKAGRKAGRLPADKKVLQALEKHGPLSIAELARECRLIRNTASKGLARLGDKVEVKGLGLCTASKLKGQAKKWGLAA